MAYKMFKVDKAGIARRKRLRKFIEDSGLVIRAFERAHNIPYGNLWIVLSGRRRISYKSAKLLAQITGTSFEEWIEE